MYEQTHKIIQTYLKKGDPAVDTDKQLFTKYMRYQISIEDLMQAFKINNSIPNKEFLKIKPEHFIRWLAEIGYIRY